ncbi:MAG: DUF177 domain-containing protein [Gammaproteobacteria bacterium]|nr:DUF177 domain-containing protein [Gammaproteobacteria bacterium]
MQTRLDLWHLAARGARLHGYLGDAAARRIEAALCDGAPQSRGSPGPVSPEARPGTETRPEASSSAQLDGADPNPCQGADCPVTQHLLGTPHVELELGSEQQHAWLRLTIQCDVRLICQRCLEPMMEHVVARNEITLRRGHDRGTSGARATNERADATSASDDASDPDVIICEMSGGDDIEPVLVDEFLLAVPLVPMHESAVCAIPDALVAGPEERRANPFAVLAELVQRAPDADTKRETNPQPEC